MVKWCPQGKQRCGEYCENWELCTNWREKIADIRKEILREIIRRNLSQESKEQCSLIWETYDEIVEKISYDDDTNIDITDLFEERAEETEEEEEEDI